MSHLTPILSSRTPTGICIKENHQNNQVENEEVTGQLMSNLYDTCAAPHVMIEKLPINAASGDTSKELAAMVNRERNGRSCRTRPVYGIQVIYLTAAISRMRAAASSRES